MRLLSCENTTERVAAALRRNEAFPTPCHHQITNILRYVQELTAESPIHAVIGGFHLSGTAFEPIIGPTCDAFAEFSPDYLVPAHCTGCARPRPPVAFEMALPLRCAMRKQAAHRPDTRRSSVAGVWSGETCAVACPRATEGELLLGPPAAVTSKVEARPAAGIRAGALTSEPPKS